MKTKSSVAIIDHFMELDDPRLNRKKEHLLIDIVTITICAVICGADDWVAISQFGVARESWFKTFLKLPNGIASHDTFGRVFSLNITREIPNMLSQLGAVNSKSI